MVNTGDTLGYASTALIGDGGAFVSWIEEGEKSAARDGPLGIARRSRGTSPHRSPRDRAPSLGYPRIIRSGTETWIAWGDSKTGVKTALLK